MAPKYSTSIDLSLLISSSDNKSYQILAYSNRLKRKAAASLPHSEVTKQLIPPAEQMQQSPLSPGDLRDFGRRLFEALIRDQVRDMYRYLEGQNIDGLSFQLMLNLQPQILQRLPWECMFDPYLEEFLCLRDNMHIIRKVERKPEVIPGDAGMEYTDLCIAIADARGQPPIDRQKEQALIDKAIGELQQGGKLNRRFIKGSQQEIPEALSSVPDVFHFIGHGGIDRNDIPGLYLEDANGDAIFVTTSELENEYFTPPPGVNRRIRLVILSACQTSETPKTEGYNSLAHQLASRVDAVLAMQFPIGLDNLTAFNFALYHALANGASLETAVNAARRKIISDKPGGARDWISPLLVTHQLTPSNILQLVSRNPFKGPIYYDIADREQFTGRESELQKLGEMYQNQDIVVITGESGCGKTSLLKAGMMAKLRSSQQPLVYVSMSENLENQLRVEINKLLTQDERTPLLEGDIENLTSQFPKDLAIFLDRVEQIEHLGEQIGRIFTALVSWANGLSQEKRRSRLVIATRLNERGEEPYLLQQQVPEAEYPRLPLYMLDFKHAKQWIETITRKSAVIFLPDTIDAILSGLNYDHTEDRNMMALQVICRAVYQLARDLHRTEATPELLAGPNDIDAILDREFRIATKLNQAVYKGGEAARKILSQFVSSDRQSMRPRSQDELLIRCGMQEPDLLQLLYQLQEDGLLHPVPHPGGDKYELVHETLVHQIDWLTDEEIELRELEEIIESAHTLIPLKSEKGGLERLDARRDELALTDEQHELLLRSALETGHETKYWFGRVKAPEKALSILTSIYLSGEAQERACQHLGELGARQGTFAETAKERLLKLACASDSPQVRQAASLALAPIMDETFINNKFGGGREDLKQGEIEALAVMFDSRWIPLKGLTSAARRQVQRKLLKINMIDILSAAARAAFLGALGFALAVVWIYAQTYRSPAVTNLPPLPILILELSLVGLLAFILATPGAFCIPLGRDISSILSGGRRSLPAALGAFSGSALGTGFTVVLLAALAEYRDPSLINLLKYYVSGAVLGGAVGLPWLLSARYPLKRTWLLLLTALFGVLSFLGVSVWENWWPETSFALTLDSRYGWVVRAVPGILIGLGSAIGLMWGKLHDRYS